MKTVAGKVIHSRPYVSDDDRADADFDHCICADIPDEKRVDVQERRFNEQRQKWRWVNVDTTHQDCPVHGCDPDERRAFEQKMENECRED